VEPAPHPAEPARTGPDPAARRAVSAVFVLNGLLVASWIVRIPDTQSRLGVGEATLGLVLMWLAVGVLCSLPLAGGAAARLGSRPVALAGAGVGAVALPATTLAPTPMTLAACLLALGAGAATMDVGMNAQGIGVEAGYGRSVLVGMHAAWSLGALVAATAGAAVLATSVPAGVHLGLVGIAVAVGTAACAPWLRIRDRRPSGADGGSPVLALPTGALVPIALVAAGSGLGESSASDWSGILMRDTVGVAPTRAAWGFVTFTAAMTIARLLGDRVTDRLGPARTVAWGGRVAAGGFVLMATVPTVPTALLGFALAGIGVAAIIPLAFAAAGRVARSPGAGMAAVATVGYAGFLLGPPLVGTVAEHLDLRVALAGVGLAVLTSTLRPRGFEPDDGAS
jgi:predicted MFS family arabinose efflux permease